MEAVRAKDKMNPACDAVAVRVETMIKPVVVTRRLEKLRIIMLNPRQTMRWIGNQQYVRDPSQTLRIPAHSKSLVLRSTSEKTAIACDISRPVPNLQARKCYFT